MLMLPDGLAVLWWKQGGHGKDTAVSECSHCPVLRPVSLRAGVSLGVSQEQVRLCQCWAVPGAGEGWHCQAELLCCWHPSVWKVPAVTQLRRPTGRWLEGWKCKKTLNNQAKNIADVVPCSACSPVLMSWGLSAQSLQRGAVSAWEGPLAANPPGVTLCSWGCVTVQLGAVGSGACCWRGHAEGGRSGLYALILPTSPLPKGLLAPRQGYWCKFSS